jgi:CspA family cold shock protein
MPGGDSMFNGIVKNFDLEKGYGFIQPTDGSVAIFVHAKTVAKAGLETLAKGQKLIFEIEQDGMGRSSISNLRLA